MVQQLADYPHPGRRLTDITARPERVLHNPVVQQRLYDVEGSRTGPRQNAFCVQYAQVTSKEQAKYSRYRTRAVWAQALVLFNVVGIPLSHGVYLEYYFTTQHPHTRLSALSIIPAIQIFAIMSMPGLVGWLYHWRGHRSGWKSLFLIAGGTAVCAQLPLQWVQSYGLILILQGPVLGVALGTLFTLSTLVLSSHYKYNLPLVSMQSGFMGLSGAVVYAFVARQGPSIHNYAPAAAAGIMAVTLLSACWLLHRIKDTATPQTVDMQLPQSLDKIVKEKGTLCFVLGYILTFYAMFTFPIYLVVILTQPPALLPPDTGTLALITCLGTAALSASITANPIVRRNIGPVNTLIAASVLAGAASIMPVFMPYLWLVFVAAGVYGIGLGAIIVLHIKTTTVFHAQKVTWHPDMPARTALVMALGGVSAFAGLCVSAVLMERMQDGVRAAFGSAGACLVGGGVLIAVARGRRCGRFGVVI